MRRPGILNVDMHAAGLVGSDAHVYTAQSEDPDLLTIPEVAARLRCSKAHAHNITNGKVKGLRPLPVLRLGRRRLVRRSTLEDWIRVSEIVASSGIMLTSLKVAAVDA